MQRVQFREFEISRLMLGTVQLGLSYGIANKTGQPSYEMARDILKCAFDGGVNAFDTAALYGSSEEALGRALAELRIADRVTVVTKLVHIADDLTSLAADEIIEKSVNESLRRLRLDSLPVCMFHRGENIAYIESLLKMKDKGLVQHIGSSTTTTSVAKDILDTGQVDAIQIPASILDHRFRSEGVLTKAGEKNAAVFARSIYLQGLLLMPEEEISDELAEVIPVRHRLRKIADDAGMTLAELGARYALGLDNVDCAVVGVETVEQMKRNIEIFSMGPLDRSTMDAIEAAVPKLSEKIVSPPNWSVRMPDATLAR